VSLDTNFDFGSGDGFNFGNFTFPPAQNTSSRAAIINLNALQYVHSLSIFPIITLG